MRHTLTRLTMCVMVSAAMFGVAQRLLAQGDREPTLKELADRLEKLEKKPAVDTAAIIKSVNDEIKKLETGALANLDKTIRQIGGDVQNLKKDLEESKADLERALILHKIKIDDLEKKLAAASQPAPALDKPLLEEMRNSLKSIQDGIARMNGGTTTRASAYPPEGPAAATTGRVILENFSNQELVYAINNIRYRVAPRSFHVIENVPLGDLNYVVESPFWGILQARSTALTPASRTFKLTAN